MKTYEKFMACEIIAWHICFVVVVRVMEIKVELGIERVHKKKQLGLKKGRKSRREKEREQATQSRRLRRKFR